MVNKIQVVIFDLAGTTVKHKREVHNSFIQAFQDEGISISYEVANDAMGKPKPVAINDILDEMAPEQKHLADRIHERFQDNIISYYRESDEVEEQSGASELFGYLKNQDIKVALDTGFDRKTTDQLIKKLGWVDRDLIDCSVTSDEVANGRPHPDMIFKIMEILGVESASQVMKIGDTPVDLMEGNSAGVMLNIGITSGAFSRSELLNYPHTHLIADLMEVKGLLA